MIGLDNIASNIGVSFENTFLFVVLIGSLIFYAKDFKLGLMMSWLFSGLCWLWFYVAGWNYVPSLVMFFIFLILLSLSLYSVNVVGQNGGGLQ